MGQDAPSKAYHRLKNNLFFFSLTFDVLLLVVFFFSGWSGRLKLWAGDVTAQPLLLNGLYFLGFALAFYVIHLPLHFYSEYMLEHQFKLSNQTLGGWLSDEVKGGVLGFCISLVLIEVIYCLLGRFPEHWWIGAGSFWLFVTFVLAKLTPNFIIPLFYKYQPIENLALKKRIFELFERCQTGLKDIYAIDLSRKTKKANAMLCGVGKNRRVVLSDTLLAHFNDEEIELVVAHELGHYKHRDIVKILFLSGAVTFIGFFLIHQYFRYAVGAYHLSGIDDIAFLPVVLCAFMLFGIVTGPILNGYSRRIEREADRFSIETTRKPKVFITMMQKLGEMNLADFDPSPFIEWFLYDHPPIGKRIAFALGFHDEG